MDLDAISKKAAEMKDQKPTIELKGYKVLGDGEFTKPVIVKAEGSPRRREEDQRRPAEKP